MIEKKKLFLAGGSGLLALNWALHCHETWDVCLGIHNRIISPTFASKMSILYQSFDELKNILSDANPDLVVNAAALTNIEYCQLNPGFAYLANVIFAEHIASACNYLQIPLVHISTDHLFSGLFPLATEKSLVNPVNIYASTKAEAEQKVLKACPNALVVRTNFYGWGSSYRSSLTDQIIKALQYGREFHAFTDVFFTPILATDLAYTIFELVEHDAFGVFNVVGNERLSKYEFAVSVVETFALPASLLHPISIEDKPLLVPRPLDLSLSNLKATNFLSRSFGNVADGLCRLRDQSSNGFQEELQKL